MVQIRGVDKYFLGIEREGEIVFYPWWLHNGPLCSDLALAKTYLEEALEFERRGEHEPPELRIYKITGLEAEEVAPEEVEAAKPRERSIVF